jgi:FSR family fosmidomycin resistance protein-like MFS transporter
MLLQQSTFLRNRAYLAVSLTHFCVDILNGGRTLLIALLAVSMGLSNAQVGIALLLYNVGNALSQPLFGLAADRFGPRWPVVGGMAWMMLFYGLAAVAGDWPALIAVTIAGLGSGAFHPSGTMVASQSSQERRTQATAVFFMAGQFGLFLGPILAGTALDQFGRPGYALLCLLALAALAYGFNVPEWNGRRHDAPTLAHGRLPSNAPSSAVPGRRAIAQRLFLPLVLIIVTTNTVSIVTSNFAPKLFTEQGYAPNYVGWMTGLYIMGSAFGGLFGGSLADRIGGKWAILLGVLGGALPIYFYIPVPGAARFALLLLAGFFGGMPHSILVIMVQQLLPGRQALASGLALGFMFFSGAIGSYFLGLIADHAGLAQTLQGTAVLLLVAAGAALFLPKYRNQTNLATA